MRKGFLLLSFAAIPVIAPLWTPPNELRAREQVGQVPLPQLTPQLWETLLQREGADQKRLHIDVGLSVDHGRVYNVTIRSGSNYPDVDKAIVNWITANWKLASSFAGGQAYVVSLDVDPALRQIVFRNT